MICHRFGVSTANCVSAMMCRNGMTLLRYTRRRVLSNTLSSNRLRNYNLWLTFHSFVSILSPKEPTVSFESTFFVIFFSPFNGCFILMGVHSVWRHQQKIRSPTIKRSDGLHLIIKTALFFVSIEQFFITLRSLIWNSNLDLNKSDWESSWKHVAIDAFSVLSWILVNHKFWQYTRTFYLEALMVCSLNK